MASVIQLARYRSVSRRDLPLEVPAGDSDLRLVSMLLWLGSLARVALAFAHQEEFGVEASLALVCVLLLPAFILRARHTRDTARQ
jgi:hypothetical protein